MEQNSQVEILEAQIRECFGRVVWTHKTQEKCADIISKRHNRIKITQIILSALVTTGLFVEVFGDYDWVAVITAIISAILLALNSFVKGHDLGEIAQKHSDSAKDLWDVREKYFSLLVDIKSKRLTTDAIVKTRDELQKELSGIYRGSPRTISAAYKEATESLKLNEELTLTDEEIDLFLPVRLRNIQNQ